MDKEDKVSIMDENKSKGGKICRTLITTANITSLSSKTDELTLSVFVGQDGLLLAVIILKFCC